MVNLVRPVKIYTAARACFSVHGNLNSPVWDSGRNTNAKIVAWSYLGKVLIFFQWVNLYLVPAINRKVEYQPEAQACMQVSSVQSDKLEVGKACMQH